MDSFVRVSAAALLILLGRSAYVALDDKVVRKRRPQSYNDKFPRQVPGPATYHEREYAFGSKALADFYRKHKNLAACR